jgi:hypothetical protein
VGEVGREATVPADHPLQRGHLADRQVVLGPAPGAGEVHVAGILGAVILRAALQVGVPDHADLLEQRQGSVHRGRVHRGEAALDPPGHVLGGDVPVGPEDLREDGLALGRDAVAALPEHGHQGSNPVHEAQASASQVRRPVRRGSERLPVEAAAGSRPAYDAPAGR